MQSRLSETAEIKPQSWVVCLCGLCLQMYTASSCLSHLFVKVIRFKHKQVPQKSLTFQSIPEASCMLVNLLRAKEFARHSEATLSTLCHYVWNPPSFVRRIHGLVCLLRWMAEALKRAL